MPIVPSQLAAPFVPAFVRNRWGTHVDKALDVADAIVSGRDDKAASQRMALAAFTIRIMSAFIAYVSQVLMARWMGPDEFGIFVWVWVIAVIAGTLSCIGFPSSLVRFIPQYKLAGDDSSTRGMTLTARLFAVGTATVVALIGAALTWFFADSGSSIYVVPLILGMSCLPMLALAETQDGLSRSFGWVDFALAPTFIIRPCLILASMATALWLGFDATAQTALFASILACWTVSIGQLLVINRRIDKTVPKVKRTITPMVWVVVALPIFLVEGFFFLLTNVDILIAGAFLPPADVAVYYAAVKTLALVHFVYFAVKAGAAHRYSQYHNAGDRMQYEGFVRETVRWTFWGSLIMSLVMVVAGKMLLSLFGPEFAAGYPLLCVLVLGIMVRSTVGPAESVLTMSGQQNICALVYGVTLCVNIALNLALIPQYGLMGAAIATTCALMFETGALYAVTLRRLGLRMFVFSPAPSPAAA